MSFGESSEDSFDSEKSFDTPQPGFDDPECDPYRFGFTGYSGYNNRERMFAQSCRRG